MMKKVLKAAGSAWGQRISLLIVICIFMAIAQPIFFRASNANSILLAIAVNGIMACGMLFTVLVGGLDLSVASTAGMSAAIVFTFANSRGFETNAFILGCAVALLFCLIVGWINGFFVTFFGLPAFVVTLAMKYVLYGSINVLTNGIYIRIPDRKGIAYAIGNSNVFGIPMPVIIFIIVAIVSVFILSKTIFGRQLYAIGGNKNAANLAGVNSTWNTRLTFMISSVAAGLGGVMLASMGGQAGQPTGAGQEGNVLMAMVVGGINLAGGEGGVSGAIVGALLVGIINNAMLLLSIGSDYQGFVQGVVILAAMTLNMYTKRGSEGAVRANLKRPNA